MTMRWLLSAVGTLAFAAAAWPQGPAPPAEPISEFGGRYDAFCLVFADAGVPLGRLAELQRAQESEFDRWILVVLGDPRKVVEGGLDLTKFVRAGGTLFFAHDRESLVTVGKRTAVLPGPILTAGPADRFLGRPDFPLVRDFLGGDGLFDGVRVIATNHPGRVESEEREWQGLASYPSVPLARAEIFAAARREGRGRFLVAADPSVFTNEMIQEADNARFAENIVGWLAGGREPASLRAAVLLDGASISSWIDERFASGDWRTRDFDALGALNELIAGLQEEDLLNALVREGQDSLSPRRGSSGERDPRPVRQAVLIVLAAAVLSATICRLFAARRTEPPPSLETTFGRNWTPGEAAHEAGGLAPADRLLEHRQLDLARQGNYAALLQELSVQFWDRRFRDVDWRAAPPRITTRMDFWSSRRAAKQLRDLWRTAVGGRDSRVREDEFRRRGAQMAELDRLLRRGAAAVEFDDDRSGSRDARGARPS
jgi:hypothetical protein